MNTVYQKLRLTEICENEEEEIQKKSDRPFRQWDWRPWSSEKPFSSLFSFGWFTTRERW